MEKWFFAICLTILLLTIIPAPCSCSEDTGPDQILYINSYDYGFSWSRLIADGVLDGIFAEGHKNGKPPAYVHMEYMDSKIIADDIHFKNLYNLLSYKLRDNTPSVIIVSDDNALRFIREYGDELFPGVPVVFTGINDYESILEDLPENYTGIVEKIPIEENIEFILRLHPELETIYFVTDDTYTGRTIREQAENITQKYEERIRIRYPLPGLDPDEMVADVKELPDNSAVLFVTYNARDRHGDKLYSDHYVYALLKEDRLPVYITMDQYNDMGVSGGFQVSAYELGRRAAMTAMEIIGGTDPGEIPVEMNTPYTSILNYEDVKRFDIKKSDIPPGTEFFNEPSSTITIPTNYATAGIILLLSLAAILAVSLVFNNRLKNTENELKVSLDEKNVLFREMHHRVKNNLAIMGSLVGMQVISSNEEETRQKLRDVGNRIISMSIVYDNIYQSENLSRVDIHTVFVTLGEGLILDYGPGVDIDFEVNGGECLIDPDKAVPLNMVINEIIGNSLKFAFEERTSGKIRIDYSCDEERFDMTISDNGKGIPESFINGETESIGLNLIRNIVSLQLNGRAEVRSDSGTIWTISFPINDK